MDTGLQTKANNDETSNANLINLNSNSNSNANVDSLDNLFDDVDFDEFEDLYPTETVINNGNTINPNRDNDSTLDCSVANINPSANPNTDSTMNTDTNTNTNTNTNANTNANKSSREIQLLGEVEVVRMRLNSERAAHEETIKKLRQTQAAERDSLLNELNAIKNELQATKTNALFLQQEASDASARARLLEKHPPMKSNAKRTYSEDIVTTVKPPSTIKDKSKNLNLNGNTTNMNKNTSLSLNMSPLNYSFRPSSDCFEIINIVLTHYTCNGKKSLEQLSEFKYGESNMDTAILDEISTSSIKNISTFIKSLICTLIKIGYSAISSKQYSAIGLLCNIIYSILVFDGTESTDIPIKECVYFAKEILKLHLNLHSSTHSQKSLLIDASSDVNIHQNIESTYRLLKTLCYSFEFDKAFLNSIWKYLEFEFLILCLNTPQPYNFLNYCIDVMKTGIFPGHIGYKPANESESKRRNHHLVKSIAFLLSDVPSIYLNSLEESNKKKKDKLLFEEKEKLEYNNDENNVWMGYFSTPSFDDVFSLRIKILNFCGELIKANHSLILSSNATFISHIVTGILLHLDYLYNRPWVNNTLCVRVITQLVKLLHGLLIPFPHNEWTAKDFATVQGNILVMSRICLSVGTVYEGQLDEETIECARNLLEQSITADETEELYAAMNYE